MRLFSIIMSLSLVCSVNVFADDEADDMAFISTYTTINPTLPSSLGSVSLLTTMKSNVVERYFSDWIPSAVYSSGNYMLIMNLTSIGSDISCHCYDLDNYISDFASSKTAATNAYTIGIGYYNSGQYGNAHAPLDIAATQITRAKYDYDQYTSLLAETKEDQSEFDYLLWVNGF